MLIPLSYLPTKRIKGVIHIGAHHAEELKSYVSHGIDDVIWIDANPENAHIVSQQIKSFPRMKSYCFAAGRNSNSTIDLNIANNGQSSSILELGSHKIHHPDVKYIKAIQCRLLSIDDFISTHDINLENFNMINIDIQGYELEALRGAINSLSNIDYIYTEVNIEQVYSNSPLLLDIESYLQPLGFTLVAKQITKYGWGDAFFAKGNPLSSKSNFILSKLVSKTRALKPYLINALQFKHE